MTALNEAALKLEIRGGAADAALARLDRLVSQSPRREHWIAERAAFLQSLGRIPEARRDVEDRIRGALQQRDESAVGES